MDTLAPPKYTARLLPPEEWGKLAPEVAARLSPESSVVCVVEDADGAIVGRWAALQTVHLEGLEILASHQKNPGVAGKLLTLMLLTLREAGVAGVLTIAQDPAVAAMATAIGFTEIPGTIFQLEL